MTWGVLSGRVALVVLGVAIGYVLVARTLNNAEGSPTLPPRQKEESSKSEWPETDSVEASRGALAEMADDRVSSVAVAPMESVRADTAHLLPDRELTARELLQKPFVDVAIMDLPRDATMAALMTAGAVTPQDAERMWANMVRGVAHLRWETQQLAKRHPTGDAGKDGLARADQELRQIVSGLVRDLPTLIRDGKAETRGITRGPAVPPRMVLGTLRCGLVRADCIRLEFVDPPCSLDIEISVEDLSVTHRSTVHAIAGEILPGGRPAIK